MSNEAGVSFETPPLPYKIRPPAYYDIKNAPANGTLSLTAGSHQDAFPTLSRPFLFSRTSFGKTLLRTTR